MKKIQIKNWDMWIGGICVLIFFIYQVQKQPKCSEYYEQEKEISFNGLVIDKYNDKKNHNFPTILIDESGKQFDYTLQGDSSGLFEFLMISDSIKKKKGFNEYVVNRSGKKFSFLLDYGCKN
jgi:hypothetical protein